MKIAILDGNTLNPGDLSWNGFQQIGDCSIYDNTDAGKIVSRAQGADILITNKVPLRKETLEQLPDLKYIGVLATGYDVIDTGYAKTRGIPVCNIPTYGTTSVAQTTFALILELCHHVQEHSDAVKRGDWSKSKDFCFWNSPLIELSGKTIGVVGFGRIGQNVADIASAFGMNILGHDHFKSDQSHRKNFKWSDLNELLEKSDVISLHCPLFDNTRGMINKQTLSRMKKTAFIINTSRGPLVCDEDLAEALNNHVIAGAALDVLSVEPPPLTNPLLSAKNCIVTPHISWATRDARSRLMNIAVDNLRSWQSGSAKNVVNP